MSEKGKVFRLFKTRYLLFLILLLAAFLRFWRLGEVPPSLSHDEVAIGYNAYSILKTGRDEYGIPFPLLFRSFDDYKLPGLVYLSVLSIALFCLNEIGVRFPSAMFGTLSVLIFYFLVKNCLSEKDDREGYRAIPLLAAFFFAISIWHINFSRQAFESNISLFFLILGVYFLSLFPKKPWFLLFSGLSFAASLYCYYSVRLIVPFVLFSFALVFRKELINNIKIVAVSFVLAVLVLLPILPAFFSSGGLARVSIVSVVNDKNYLARKALFAQKTAIEKSIFNRIVYNRRVALVLTIGENYLKNISPSHIFKSGTDSAGLVYPLEAPFLIFGFLYIARRRSRFDWVFLALFFSSFLPGALSVDQPNPLRTLPAAPILSLFSAYGVFAFFLFIFHQFSKKVVFVLSFILGLLLTVSFIRWFNIYFYLYPQQNSLHFGDGYKQMVEYVSKNKDKYERIFISGEYWRPYIFVLFWGKYDPALYQRGGTRDHFDKFYFARASWDREGVYFADPATNFYALADNKKTLFILSWKDFLLHKEKFVEIERINGRYKKDVFVAALLR